MITSPASTSQTSFVKAKKRLQEILDSTVFNQLSASDSSWKPAFCEVIILLDNLLTHADQSGHRLDFTEEVGVNGKVQDITSLVSWMRSFMPRTEVAAPDPLLSNRLNWYHNAGAGYFANGLFFRSDYPDDTAFFLDDQRIYLKRHIQRSFQEVELA